MPLAACLASACYFLAADAKLRIFMLDAGIKLDTREKLRRSIASGRASLTFVAIPSDDEIRSAPGRLHLTWVVLTKLLIPDLLPKVEKAIWLDSDMVVCVDLTPLWQTDMRAPAMLARSRPSARRCRSHPTTASRSTRRTSMQTSSCSTW